MGDPRGIGAEIILKSLKYFKKFTISIIGDTDILSGYAEKYGVKDIDIIHIASTGNPGADSLNYIKEGLNRCLKYPNSSLVTAPVSKSAIAQIEKGFTGHTEYITKHSGAKDSAMTFISTKIKLSLLTTHLSLKEVLSSLNIALIERHIKIINDGLKKWFKIKSPRIVISSLNPHCGENGVLGLEEKIFFIPAILRLKKDGINVTGPVSASQALTDTLSGKFDFIVSPYHDQLLTSLKTLLGPSVNFTMGLPFIRTSPDHGTAFEIAGKNLADESSMKAAIKLAKGL